METDLTADVPREPPETFPDAPAAIGEVLFERWTVSEIHRGGQAWVLVVDDIEQKNRRAIKVPLSGALTGDAELAVLLRLEPHPHVVTALDVVTVNGRQGLMLEFAPTTLAELLRHQRLASTPQQPWLIPRPEIMQEICDGMAYLSTGAEFAHLDLKPSNVLIDGAGRAKIADFGLAQQVRIKEDGRFPFATGGTWAYAAPEVIRRGHCDSRSDIFSFGVLLYEACTGRLPYPFPLASTPAAQRAQLLDYYESSAPEDRVKELYYWNQTKSKMTQVPIAPPSEAVSIVISNCLEKCVTSRPPHFRKVAVILAERLRIPVPPIATIPLSNIDWQHRQLTLGQALVRLGRFGEALRQLNRLLASAPPSVLSRAAIQASREALIGAGRHAEANALEEGW